MKRTSWMTDPADEAKAELRGSRVARDVSADGTSPDDPSQASPIKSVVRTLFARKWSIVLVTLMVELGIGLAVFWLLVPTYESKARLHVDLQLAAMPVMRTEGNYVSDIEKMAFFETIVQEIETQSLIEGVVRDLKLDERRVIGRIEWLMDQYKAFKRWLGNEFDIESWKAPPDPFGASVAAVIGNLSTNRLENSTILEMVYYSKGEDECQETLAAVVQGYIKYRNDFIRSKAAGSAEFLEPEIDRVRKELESLENEWAALMREEAMPLVGQAWDVPANPENEVPGSNGKHSAQVPAVVGMITNELAVEQMMLRLIAMQEELERILADGRGSHPTVKPLRELIAAYVEAVNKSPEVKLRVHRLQREMQSKERIYNELLATHQATQTMTSEELRRLNAIQVIQEASPPGGPVSPKRMVAMLSGLILGLVLGVIYALVKEFLDATVKSPEDIRSKLGLTHIISMRKA